MKSDIRRRRIVSLIQAGGFGDGGGGFSPSQFSNQAYWFRGDSKDVTGSDVDKAINKFGVTTYDAAKVADATRPTVVSGPNSKDAFRFTAASNQLLQATNFPSLTDFTFFIVFKANSTAGTQTIIQNQDLATQGFKIRIASNTITLTVQNSGEGGSGVTTTSFAFTDTASWHVLTVKYYRQRIAETNNGTSSYLSRVVVKLDNAAQVSVTNQRRTVVSTAVTKIGSNSTPNSLDADIAEIVCLSKFATEADELNYYTYVNTYFGLSITLTMPTYYIESTLIVTPQSSGFESANQALQFKVSIPNSDAVKIPLIVVPGYGESIAAFTTTVMRRLASGNGGNLAVIACNHRGISSSQGSQDDGARQVHDYYDILTYFKNAHPDIVNSTVACGYGISAGGGDMLGAGVKFPDLYSVIVAHFPMSDYGYDGTFGWWAQEVSFRAALQTNIGNTPALAPNEYRSRYHKESIAGNYKGHLFLIHDASDSTVEVNHSDRVKTEYDNISNTNYTYLRSASPDVIRYTHGYPTDAGTTGIATAEPTWKAVVLVATEKTMADSATVRVNGYMITKKFKIWLGNGTAAANGKNRSADLTYDWVNNSYTVTPILETGATDEVVIITVLSGAHSGKTVTSTISVTTVLTPV